MKKPFVVLAYFGLGMIVFGTLPSALFTAYMYSNQPIIHGDWDLVLVAMFAVGGYGWAFCGSVMALIGGLVARSRRFKFWLLSGALLYELPISILFLGPHLAHTHFQQLHRKGIESMNPIIVIPGMVCLITCIGIYTLERRMARKSVSKLSISN